MQAVVNVRKLLFQRMQVGVPEMTRIVRRKGLSQAGQPVRPQTILLTEAAEGVMNLSKGRQQIDWWRGEERPFRPSQREEAVPSRDISEVRPSVEMVFLPPESNVDYESS
jgi:hypothetical protein